MSPLELFRRNQKVTMTFLILLAMFAFVVLPTVSQYMQQSGLGMNDPVVAEFNGVSLTASRVSSFTRKHYATVQFLRKLAEETRRRGGTSKIFTIDPRTDQIESVGINGAPNDEMSIRTLQFAAAAQELGFDLDDTSLELWLEQFTDGTVSEREMFTLLRRETNNRMGQYQLYDMLRKQLLAALYFRSAGASVSRGQFPLQSPLDHWKNFLKLNQKATINAYGVLVNDFIAETDSNPSESQVIQAYEAGKDRYPSNQSPDPGFRRRDSASFEYLLADLQTFRDAEVAKLSVEEIEAEYEKRKSGGAFQLPADVEMEEVDVEIEAPTPPAEPAATEEAADDTQAAQQKQVEEFRKELQEAGKLDPQTPAEDDQSSHSGNPQGVRLVTLQADVSTEASADTPTETPAGTPTEPSAETPAETPQGTPAEASTETPPAETPPAETAPAETAADETAAQASTETPAETSPETPAETDSAAPEPKFRPFEEVREQIAQTMVDDLARAARDQAVSKARSIMKRYSRELALYESDPSRPEPQRPDLKAVGEELGLSYNRFGPLDPVALADEPIADSVEEGTALSQRGVTFTEMMFGGNGQVVELGLFTPAVTVDLEAQQTYVSWKTEETEAFTPELDVIRDEVVAAIRMEQARKLAEQAAEAMAAAANESGSLEELIPDDRKDNYFKDLGPFSWYNMVGFGGFTIGNVPELDSINEDFMEVVFNAEDGEYVVAPNGPERVYYVVKRTSLLPATADLRAIFSQQSERMMAMFMSDGSAAQVQEGFFNAIDKQTGFERYALPQ